MVVIWSPEQKVIDERRLWVRVLKSQKRLGLPFATEDIAAYERVLSTVNLASIREREIRLRQDVKARIEEFNALASLYARRKLQLIHEAFTSRDLTDNIEQAQVRASLLLLRDRTVAVLARLGMRSQEFQLLAMTGRSHNMPGQVTTLGKRFATFAEELLIALDRLEHLIARYPLRGIKGAMGTQQDMLDLLGSAENVAALEADIREHLGFPAALQSTGQVYPRSLDLEVASVLAQLAAAPANFALMVRLMAGHQLLHEGFGSDQTGSTAMPHKLNARTCERIRALKVILNGYLAMAAEISGEQWLEGDVSCSAVRRIVLPGVCMALDGIFQAFLTVLDEMEVFPGMITAELNRFLPFLSSTRLLMAGLKAGMGREQAHAIIKRHAVGVLRRGQLSGFIDALAADPDYPLGSDQIQALVETPVHGLAHEHVDRVSARIADITDRYPDAAAYVPEEIL